MEIKVIEKSRLDKYVSSNLKDLSRVKIAKMISHGKILLNNEKTIPHKKVLSGDIISIPDNYTEELIHEILPKKIDFEVIFENDDFAIINKPPGIKVHPTGAADKSVTLVNGLKHRFKSLSTENGDLRPGIVHRLDKDTSGLMIIAKNNESHAKLAKLFADRKIEKIYSVLVNGHIKIEKGIINVPIGRNRKKRTKMCLSEEGKDAITHFRLIKYYGEYSLLEIKLITGRTHQIRVHFSAMHNPVAGDHEYAPRKVYRQMKSDGFNRIFLHCKKIAFSYNGKKYSFTSKLPEDLKSNLKSFK